MSQSWSSCLRVERLPPFSDCLSQLFRKPGVCWPQGSSLQLNPHQQSPFQPGAGKDAGHFILHRREVHLVQGQVRTDYSFLSCQSMKGRPPPAPLFGDDDDDDDIDWLG